MKKLKLEESKIRIKVGGGTVNNLQNAENTTLLLETKEGLKHLIRRIKEEGGLSLNVKKSKLMTSA